MPDYPLKSDLLGVKVGVKIQGRLGRCESAIPCPPWCWNIPH